MSNLIVGVRGGEGGVGGLGCCVATAAGGLQVRHVSVGSRGRGPRLVTTTAAPVARGGEGVRVSVWPGARGPVGQRLRRAEGPVGPAGVEAGVGGGEGVGGGGGGGAVGERGARRGSRGVLSHLGNGEGNERFVNPGVRNDPALPFSRRIV
ncbi:hypothetical protein EYF80_063960 [Liparis tanakae]|uniref:Uncharacterized protein n=1 Tax=Liparis tanakae TaxID=230148 RepID=A0A4Z2EBI1_9TELE|nr:hypothetical protein EYF80_063960 [Liparis tanakae]